MFLKRRLVLERETLKINDLEIDLVRRSYRRTISMTLQMNGRIRVNAPKGASHQLVQGFIATHQPWIDANLAKYDQFRGRFPKKEYREGDEFPLLGQKLKLTFKCGTRAGLHFDTQGDELSVAIAPNLWPHFRPHDAHPELARPLRDLFAQIGRTVLQQRLDVRVPEMGYRPTAVRFRAQKTRWGSCTIRGVVSLNWKLVFAPIEVIDYVVVHELAHLEFYDHSPKFWKFVERYVPNYRDHRQWLKTHQYDADFLAKKSELHDSSVVEPGRRG